MSPETYPDFNEIQDLNPELRPESFIEIHKYQLSHDRLKSNVREMFIQAGMFIQQNMVYIIGAILACCKVLRCLMMFLCVGLP